MSLFDRFRSDETAVETSETGDDADDSEDMVDLRVTEILYNYHTVHLGEATFTNGDTERFMFDAMEHKNDYIVLYDYVEWNNLQNKKKAFVTISPNNLKTFETIRREEVRVRVGERVRDMGPKERQFAEEYAEKSEENDYIKSVEILE